MAQGGGKKPRMEELAPQPMPVRDRNEQSVKADGAEIPEYLWDLKLVPDFNPKGFTALKHLQTLALRWWKSYVQRDSTHWFFLTYPVLKKPLDDKRAWGTLEVDKNLPEIFEV
jgi:hypothetical protein